MAAAEGSYIDYIFGRGGRRSDNPFNDANSDEGGDDLGARGMRSGSDTDDRGSEHGRSISRGRSGPLQTIGETSEPHTSSGTDTQQNDPARRAQPLRAPPSREAAADDAYVGGPGSRRSRSTRSKPSDPSVPQSHFSDDEKEPRFDHFDTIPVDHGATDAESMRNWRAGQPGAPPSGPNVLSDHVVPLYEEMNTLQRIILEIKQAVSFMGTAMSFNLFFFLAIGDYLFAKVNPKHKFPPTADIDNAWLRRIPGERFSSRTEYYCEFWGYDCEAHDIETEDGFILRMYHIMSRRKRAHPGPPILIQHGILCNSSNFVLNEERSMAFWFVEQGYDVWLGNIRTNYGMPHRKFERWDPRYWAWSFKEIGIYDCTAQIEYVFEQTGQRVNYVGHSQGGGTMFLALSHGMRPDIGEKMASFCALAPAVYAGDVLHKFPFSILRLFKSRTLWALAFGQRDFFPILALLQKYIPGWLFGHLAIPVFFFIFGFHDHNWVPRQVPKFFRSTPVATSAELLYFYMGNFSYNMCIFDESAETWFPPGFPPLGLWYGDIDTLVDGRSALKRLRANEKHVPLDVAYELHNHEHLDMIWGVNVVEECFIPMLRFIENANSRNIEEGYVASPPRSKKGSLRSKSSRNGEKSSGSEERGEKEPADGSQSSYSNRSSRVPVPYSEGERVAEEKNAFTREV